ncbi:MAG: phenylalanine--tRNA ligase subunit beta [Bacteroidota bacterium]
MKLSYNWLKQYISFTEDPISLGSILTAIGLEVEGIETIESLPGGLKGLVVGEIITCQKHPNADRLSLTTVNIGKENNLQIICGAPNVAAGQKVIVATVGCELYPSNNEPFKIKKGKIRGEVSEGMICAEDEIGVGESHDGIIVLPESTEVGIPAAQYYDLREDYIFDIGLTPNRSDATSHMGVARDLNAYFLYHREESSELIEPDTIELNQVDPIRIEVNVVDPIGCPRFSGVSFSDVKLKPSPDWMQIALRSVGVRPINNVVDITNYVLHEMGQPLHAYDESLIPGSTINVKCADAKSPFIGLDDKERILTDQDLAICDGNERPIGLAGVFGGNSSGVQDTTTKLYLEAAHFNAIQVRKTSTYHQLRTDAAKVFEKGSDPNLTAKALERAAYLLVTYADAKINSGLTDVYPTIILPKEVVVDLNRINNAIGISLTTSEVDRVFKALSFDVSQVDGSTYHIQIPTNKVDVTREADVIEEVLRIYGYNNVQIDHRIRSAMLPSQGLSRHQLRNALAESLRNSGFNEMMAMSLTKSSVYQETPYEKHLVFVNNTSNVHLDVMRPEMMLSSLQSVQHNANRQQVDLKLFELGRSYAHVHGVFEENEYLTIVMCGRAAAESWRTSSDFSAYPDIHRMVLKLFRRIGVDKYQQRDIEDYRFAYGLQFHRGDMIMANLGECSSAMREKNGVDVPVFYAEINLDSLAKMVGKSSLKTAAISKYPSVRRDIAVVIPKSTSYNDIRRTAVKAGGKLLAEVNLFDVFEDDSVLGLDFKSYGLSMTFIDMDSSLKDKQIDKIVNKVVADLSQKLGAKLR